MVRVLTTEIILTLIVMAVVTWGASLPFDAARGLVEVPVTIDGRVTGTFGIDTGADRLYIDRTFALKHQLADGTVDPQRKVAGVNGSTGGTFTKLRSLAIGDERLYNLTATVIDINAINKDHDGIHPDGLIGYDVLSRLYVTVDYPSREIELTVVRPAALVSGNCRSVSFDVRRHFIIVDATFADGKTRPMMLDYCASYTSISPSLADALGFDSEPGKVHNIGSIIVGDEITTDNVDAIVTDYSSYKRSIGGISFEGVIGGSFLYRHKITVSYKQKKIYLHD